MSQLPAHSIAIIGLAGRFPGADDVAQFWENLRNGVESISRFSDEELLASGRSEPDLPNPALVRAGAVIDRIELFDAAFFGVNPREAEILDPQHRIFLECSHTAIEDAGYDYERFEGRIGVFGGSGTNSYFLYHLFTNEDFNAEMFGAQMLVQASDKDYLCSRTSYKLNLKGPSLVIQTACSTSLVAVHIACQSLLNQECDLALAGGVTISARQKSGYFYRDGAILSPDGHCRAFDANAQGTVPGNGAGIVVLKRLEQALADGDFIRAVIVGTAINNDGSLKMGYTAPSVEGQAEVIAEAQAVAGIEPDAISYIEAHGTGTQIGDPIEIEALTEAFRFRSVGRQFCALGSVKTNIGHLDTAAGVAGLIKTTLALQHKMIPPSLNFETPHPAIDFENSPFYVNGRLSEWKTDGRPRRAGVSSFGIGGVNAHLIVEEAPAKPPSGPSRSWQLLVLSAKTDSALETASANLAEHLKSHNGLNLADAAYTLQVGRRAFEHRRIVVCNDSENAVKSLSSLDPKRVSTARVANRDRALMMIFPGQGSQYVNMGLELYRNEPAFKAQMDFCSDTLNPLLGLDLCRLLYPDENQTESATRQLDQTFITQPALFAIEYSLAQLWLGWGFKPRAFLGHSIGEYVAACLSGVFSLTDALSLVARRGQLMQSLPGGVMLSVAVPESEIKPFLNHQLALAAVNSGCRCVVSGPDHAIAELEDRLGSNVIKYRRIATSHAFHSQMMDPIMKPFADLVRKIRLNPPNIPYISNVTGAWITGAEATDPGYWSAHLRQAVRFADGLRTLTESGETALLEVGPGRTLSAFIRQQSEFASNCVSLTTLRSAGERQSDEEQIMETIGKLWLAGLDPDWESFHLGQERRRLALPTYPFEGKRYWIESPRKSLNLTPQENQVDISQTTPVGGNTPVAARQSNPALLQQEAPALQSLRREELISQLKLALKDLIGIDTESLDLQATFVDLGADSLLLVQVSQLLEDRFQVKVPFRWLFEKLTTLDLLATYLANELPEEYFAPEAVPQPKSNGQQDQISPVPQAPGPICAVRLSPAEPMVPAPTWAPATEHQEPGGEANSIERIFIQQLQVMSRLMSDQLGALRGVTTNGADHNPNVAPATAGPIISQASSSGPAAPAQQAPGEEQHQPPRGTAVSPSGRATTNHRVEPFVPYRPLDVRSKTGLTARQQKYLDSFIERYTRRTAQSKSLAAAARRRLADPRLSTGFRSILKEIIYPLYSERMAGSRVWDVDGNEYVDVAMGYGVNLFGNSPQFVVDAVNAQLSKGLGLTPQLELTGKVAELICELTGAERANFCNSGTEAVGGAIRIARAVTRRKKIAIFAGAFHGWSDPTLARQYGWSQTVPSAPGVLAETVKETLALDYGNPESLEIIRKHAHELAAVLVEPVQSRRPDLQPGEFLCELRKLTADWGIALIFDEMVTGFRLHQGGAQAWFNIKADIVTYGKIVGGGMPIGVIAGKASFLDAFDGGRWNYGDSSYPQSEHTFFAGTFFKHPLSMAAAYATLKQLKLEGPALQERLNRRTAQMIERIRTRFAQNDIPIQAVNCGSLFRFFPSREGPLPELFFCHMTMNGAFNWEGGNFFLSTAHTDEDVDLAVAAIFKSVEQLKSGGFLLGEPNPPFKLKKKFEESKLSETVLQSQSVASPDAPAVAVAPSFNGRPGDADLTIPVPESQRQVWIMSQMGDEASKGLHVSLTIHLRGRFNLAAMRRAITQLFHRHQALRATAAADGESQIIHQAGAVKIPASDFSYLSDDERKREVESWLRREAQSPFNLERGPLARFSIARLEAEYHLLVLTAHHFIVDGRSNGIIIEELTSLYSAECEGVEAALPEAAAFTDYVQKVVASQQGAQSERDEEYWRQIFSDDPLTLELPLDRPRPSVPTYRGAHCQVRFDPDLTNDLEKFCSKQSCSPFMAALACFKVLLHQLSGQDEMVVGINVAQQRPANDRPLVAFAVNPLAIRSRLSPEMIFSEYLDSVKERVFGAYEHQRVTFNTLNRITRERRDPKRWNVVSVAFNFDRSGPTPSFSGLQTDIEMNSIDSSRLDLYLDVTETSGALVLEANYNADLFERATIRSWLEHYQVLLKAIAKDPEQPIAALPQFQQPAARTPSNSETVELGLTKYQLLIWAGQKLHTEAPMYINAGYWIIPAAIDWEHYMNAVRACINNCDALRIVIADEDGEPRQKILPDFPYEPEFQDFSEATNPYQQLDDWASRRCRTTLNMRRRMFDLALIKLADTEYAIYANLHHIVTDAWSTTLIIALMDEYYRLSLAGRLDQAEKPPQFRDFIQHELESEGSPRARRAQEYWKQKLAEEIEPVKFYGRTTVRRTTRAQRVSCELGVERTEKLKALARRAEVFIMSDDVSLHHVFATIVATFLYHISGNRRLSMGVPLHNRKSRRQIIGLLMQILPLRVSIEEGDSFISLIGKIGNEFLNILRHHEYQVGNPLQRPAYDVEFNFMNARNLRDFNGAPVKQKWLHPGHATDNLAIQVYDTLFGGFTCAFDFHCDVFDEGFRQLAIDHFLRVIDALLEDARRPIDSVSLISEAERNQIVAEFNATHRAFPQDQTFAQLFQLQARRAPDRLAVSDEQQSLTYEELNRRSNRLAHQLIGSGVGPETVVSLIARRDVEFLIAVLAIAKAGGVYLPLDPEYPPERVARILRQSRCRFALAAEEFSPDILRIIEQSPIGEPPPALIIHSAIEHDGPETDPPPRSSPASLSYVIYTSGSTGDPKGAMIEQSGMINHLYLKVNDLPLTESDVVTQSAAQCSDVSIWQLLSPLLVGAKVQIVSDRLTKDSLALLELADREGLTILEIVSSQLRAMIEGLMVPGQVRPGLSSLKLLIVNGEVLAPDLCRGWHELYPGVPLMNAYGPTECSDDVTHYRLRQPPPNHSHVPIGRPLANLQLYVLDSQLSLAPIGVAGEIYIVGAGVGRGYLNNPEQTAQSFLPASFADQPGRRMYKTGDRGRYLPDGNLDFIDRIDHQVKIRGFRVELGEVESVLWRHTAVAQVVAMVREDEQGDRRLVTYVLTAYGQRPTATELRGYLRERLPDYMIPSTFVLLDAFPLLPNGKVNRKALPAPDSSRPELECEFVEPRNETEATLARIWAEALGLERVGAHDNFFDLGGDSIMIILIAAKANQAGLRLAPTQIFEHQTVAELAVVAGSAAAIQAEQGAVTGSAPLTPVQRWFFEQEISHVHHYNQALMLELRESIDSLLLEKAVARLISHHDALRLRFKREGGDWRQFHDPDSGRASYSMVDLSAAPRAEQSAAIEARAAELQASLDLSEGPVFRAMLFNLGGGQASRLFLVAHHLVIDGVSWRILLTDLQLIHQQLKRGQEIQLPSKTTSFKQWGERLAEYGRSAELQSTADYWLGLASEPVGRLPLDFGSAENTRESVDTVTVMLDEAETAALLRDVGPTYQAQISDLLLSALARALSAWTGAQSHLINLEGHGRDALFDDLDVSRTIGWFTTMFPVLLTADNSQSPLATLKSVKDDLRQIPDHGRSYGLLRYLTSDSRLREQFEALPPGEVEFNYLGQVDQILSEASLFKLAAESGGPSAAAEGLCAPLVDIVAIVVNQQLRIDWRYSRNLHRRSTIECVAECYIEELKSLIALSRSLHEGDEWLDSDQFGWSSQELDEIESALDLSLIT
jgi:amino acid adenylation domain-containing protein/non-ribosomal peptide synthase protein (TIGR01720 family)